MEEISLITICISALSFFAAGFINAIAGGGGLISLPMLLLCSVPPHMALSTGKLASIFGGLASLQTFWSRGIVEKKIAFRAALSSFIGGIAGALLALVLSKAFLGKALVFLLPVGIIISLFSGRHIDEGTKPNHSTVRIGLIGVIIGWYDAFFGPAAGSFFIIAQRMFLHFSLLKAAATAKCFNTSSNVGAFLVFLIGGTMYFPLAIPCAVGSMIGNRVGASLAVKKGVPLIRKFLYFTMILLTCTLFVRFVL